MMLDHDQTALLRRMIEKRRAVLASELRADAARNRAERNSSRR